MLRMHQKKKSIDNFLYFEAGTQIFLDSFLTARVSLLDMTTTVEWRKKTKSDAIAIIKTPSQIQ